MSGGGQALRGLATARSDRNQYYQQDIARREDAAEGVGQMAGFGEGEPEAGAAVEERAVDATAVGRIEMDDAVALFSKPGPSYQAPDRLSVLHLRKAYYIGQGTIFVGGKENSLGNAVTFVPEVRPVGKEVLHVPEHQQKSRPPVICDGKTEK